MIKGKSTYNPHLQGSDTDPGPNCDASIARDTQKDLDIARASADSHRLVNEVAEKGHK